ncbi:glycosyltransferase [Cyanobacterium stanieri]|uniref:glycosyltransferase n=1 Tax=Cyanobacterium stanieri TaxID=102235 RepID=UPI0019D626CF|nr:glycosyltransferase [Cyanobacterium stanieri]
MNTNKHSLKISIIVSDLSSSGSGRWGGAVRPFLLAKALQKMGHQVKIFGLGFGVQTPQFSKDIPIVYIPSEYHSGIIDASKELISQIDGDILYAIKPKTTSFGLAIIKKLTSGCPLILDIDDWEMSWFGGDKWKFGFKPIKFIKEIVKEDGALRYPDHPLYLRWLEKFISYADAVTTHNTFLQKKFGGVYIPQGKDLELFNPSKFDPITCKRKYGLENYRVLMFPGAPRPYKGLEDLLEAMDLLQWEDLKLVIVGGSPYDDYDKYLQERWSKWIISIPPQPFEQMPEIISCADVMVIPQRKTPETIAQFPLKLTDAMAMAKPILATRVGDIPEVLQDTGYLVNPQSPEDLAQGIKTIFQGYQTAIDKGLKARERYFKYYSQEQMVFMLDQVIASLPLKK